MLTRILDRPGARAVPQSPGEAISRFRDDVNNATDFTAQLPFLIGQALFAIFALFIFYLGFTTEFTAMTGVLMAWYKQAGVALARMITLLQGAPPLTLVKHTPVYVTGELPPVPYTPKTDEHRLEEWPPNGIRRLNLKRPLRAYDQVPEGTCQFEQGFPIPGSPSPAWGTW